MKITPKELKNLYEKGENISEILREDLGLSKNNQEIIEVSYDLQSGSYIESMNQAETVKFNN